MAAGLRARDSDRDACIEKLEAAYADGRITGPEREHRVSRALAAVTLADLAALTTDLEIPAATSDRRTAVLRQAARRNSFAVLATIVAVPVVLIVTFTVFIVASVTSSPSGSSSSTSSIDDSEALQLHTADGFAELVRLTREKFGSAVVTDGAIYPDYASLEVPVGDSPNRVERWYFKSVYSEEPSSRSTRIGSRVTDIDLARIDPQKLADAVARTPTAMKVPDPTSVYVVLSQDFEGTPYYSVYASNEFSETGWWRFDLDGNPIESHPFGS